MRQLTCCDHRNLDPEDLAERFRLDWAEADGGLLTTARRPRKRWTQDLDFARPLILSSAPQFELILWTPLDLALELSEEVATEQDYLLGRYKPLFDGREAVADYVARLTTHIEHQESVLFPQLTQLAPIERALRELSYEHRGLEKGALRIPELVAQAQAGTLTAKSREQFDLDFFHLLEHHVERERDALFPAQKFLQQFSPLPSRHEQGTLL